MSKKIIFIIGFLIIDICFNRAYTQEVRSPLLQNVKLKQGQLEKQQQSLADSKKTGVNFPFIDYFISNGVPSNKLWSDSNTTIVNRQVVFNTTNATGGLYTDTFQPIDILTSLPIDISGLTQAVFISFSVSSGSSFTNGDSLVFEAKDIFGSWQTLWSNNGLALLNQEVEFIINPTQFSSSIFEIRWKAFTSQLNATNNQTFLLSKVVLSQTLPFPWYENIKTFNAKDSCGSALFFSSPDVKVAFDNNTNFPWGKCLKLDVLNANKQVYDNGSGLYGGADTLYLNPFDVLKFAVNDSLYFSFSARGINGLLTNDSLLVEFKNNLGVWVRTFSLAGTASNGFNFYTLNINRGRNRHANLQVRFIFKSNYNTTNTAAWLISGFRINRKIEMPFIDDFSASRIYADPAKWTDKYVFINNDFPVNQPSVNVATLDGLDEKGNAYSKFPLKGTCDKLTSQPFNLVNFKKGDSLILSFYYQYQPQGTTSQIYPDDSLILEFRSTRFDKDSFEIVWKVSANINFFKTFQRIDMVLTDPKYFHDDFQFRFRNHGSLTGNLSQWHIDYIRFDKNRKRNDPYDDISLTNTPRVMLGKYSSMPWNQYTANTSAYSNTADTIRIANHHSGAYNVDYLRSVIGPQNDSIDKFVNNFGNLLPQSSKAFAIGNPFTFKTTVSKDSLIFDTRYRLKISGTQIDNITSNDTFGVSTVFSNYLAFDDGTAEAGYGVQLETNVGVSLKYTLEIPDSLYGVYIFFNQSEQDVSTQRFNIRVWERISPLFEQATDDKIIYSQEVLKPVYMNTINGFAAFKFTSPVPVKNSFYIGWEQINAYVLNVGMDENYPPGVNPNMAYKMDGRWYPAEIKGALMIRPIIGKFLDLPASLVQAERTKAPQLTIFPNPAKNELNIETDKVSDYVVSIFDMMGRNVLNPDNNNGKIQLPELPSGMYILVLQNRLNQIKMTRKIMINQEK